MKTNGKSRFAEMVLLAGLALSALVASSVAVPNTVTTAANQPTVIGVPVTVGQTSAEVTFPVAAVDRIQFQVIAPVNGATLSVLDPTGFVAIASNDPGVAFLDGALQTPPLPGGVFSTPAIESPDDGEWTVQVQFPPAAEDTVVLATLFAASRYQVGIVLEKSEFRRGQTVSLGMIVLDDGQPILSLDPQLTVTPPTGAPEVLAGADDGNPANLDGLQDDGIYSAPYMFAGIGTYTIEGDVTIPVAGAAPVQRTASATVTVTEPLISLAGVSGAVDLDPTGCVAGLAVHVSATTNLPIDYIASAKLVGGNGNNIKDSVSQTLAAPGPVDFDLYFHSEDIRDGIAFDSPYTVSPVDLLSLQDEGVALEIRELNAWTFDQITLDDLCAPPIGIAQNLTVTPVLRGDMIESLGFSFPIVVANSGSYQISFKITDGTGQDVEIYGFSRFLNAGSNTVSASLPYTQFQSLDGPFSVESVLVLGQGSNAQQSVVGSSDPYSRWQFVPTISGDLDADGDVDAGDRAVLLSYRNQPALVPGDRRDLTGDSVIDLRDARHILRLACQAGSCPTN